MDDYNITFEIDDESSKKIFDKINQENEDRLNRIQQHFEERWQETINNRILLGGNPSEESVSFIKNVFLYGCNVGWNDCYTFHENLIQKGLNQQLDKWKK